MFKYELGSKVKCRVTGFTGVVVGRSEWLHGCLTYSVKPMDLKDGKPQDSVGFDEGMLDVVVQAPPHEPIKTGGPAATPATVSQ